MVRNDIKCPWLFFIDIFSQSVLDIDAQYSWNQEENKIFYSTYYQRERSSLKKSYGSLSRNNKWTLGSFILSRPIVVILTHFVNVYWTSPKQWNLKTSVSCFPEMQRKLFHSSRKIPATILVTVCYFLYQAFSSDNFLLNQTSSFINILQIIDRKVIFDTVFAPTTYTKELSAHLANTVEPFQSSWTNGKQFAYVSTVQMKFRHTRQLSLCQRNQYFSRLTVTEEVFGEIFALKNKVLHFKLA